MAGKRYVLLVSESSFAEVEKDLADFLERRFGRVKLIEVEGSPQAVIVRTTVDTAAWLKDNREGFFVRGIRLTPVLTSGAVGNLKRRAGEAKDNGKVHER